MSGEIFIIGHKNPDTDSICSSLAYAYLKNKLDGNNTYVPARAGDINAETQYVLDYFNMIEPQLITDVKTQVKDINIKKSTPVAPDISLKKAWETMKNFGLNTLLVSSDGKLLDGIITVGAIAQSYMDIYDSRVLSMAATPYRNIVEVLEGEIIVGNIEDCILSGQVLIGAMNPEVMENYIQPMDIVILGNRYETQLCAVEMGAQCMIVTGGIPVAASIKRLAESKNCSIIISPMDTYTVARFINQSIPIRYFMKSNELTIFDTDDYVDDIREIMVKKRYRNFPVVDNQNQVVGMLSRASLINLQRKQVILVDHNERSQSVDGIDQAEILEIIDHHRIGNIETAGPVYFRNQPLGCTATIVANVFKENNIEIPKHIAGILCAAILSDTLMFKSPTCTAIDRNTAEYLAKIADIQIIDFAKSMFRADSNLVGKSDEEIFHNDLKEFKAANLTFTVGQINSMDNKELEDIRERILLYMKKIYREENKDMVLFMLTDIVNECSELLFVGNRSDLIKKAFDGVIKENSIILPGVVSRKKQIIPPLLSCI